MKKSELRQMIREALLSERQTFSSKEFGDLIGYLKGNENDYYMAISDKAASDPKWDKTFSKHVSAIVKMLDKLD